MDLVDIVDHRRRFNFGFYKPDRMNSSYIRQSKNEIDSRAFLRWREVVERNKYISNDNQEMYYDTRSSSPKAEFQVHLPVTWRYVTEKDRLPTAIGLDVYEYDPGGNLILINEERLR